MEQNPKTEVIIFNDEDLSLGVNIKLDSDTVR